MTANKAINEAANMWNKTKDPKYKKLWYKLVKQFSEELYASYENK